MRLDRREKRGGKNNRFGMRIYFCTLSAMFARTDKNAIPDLNFRIYL